MFKIAIIVDCQTDFTSPIGALPVPGAEKIVPTIDEYLSYLTLENGYMGVLFTADTHTPEEYKKSKEAEEFPEHCMVNTPGFDFSCNPKLVPRETPKMILNKSVFSMWEQPGLKLRPFKVAGEPVAYGGEVDRDEWFANLLANGVEEVEVVGFAADYCVKWAVDGLLLRGFNVTLYDNLTAGIQRDIHQVVNEDFVGQPVRVL